MRSLSAIILLIPMLILFTGSVNLASYCTAASAETCAAQPSASAQPAQPAQPAALGQPMQTSSCCGMKHCHKAATACQGTKKDHPSEDHRSCCFDCPLCSPVTLSSFYCWQTLQPGKRTEYTVMTDNPLNGYLDPHWKPPDFSLSA